MAKLKSFAMLPDEIRKKLQDLSPALKEVTIDKEGWCYKYRDKKEIGEAIYKDFLAYTEEKTGVQGLFPFSDELSASGILSQLQGFQVLAVLIEEFDCALDSKRILSILDGILDDVTKGASVRFDATPYLPESRQFERRAYIDTITWFVSCACSVFRLVIQKGLVLGEERKSRLVELFCQGVDYLTNNFIDAGEETPFRFGWNYTEKCKEPSLYFTFSVSEVLIDIFSTFENVIRAAETEFVQAQIDRVLGHFEGNKDIADEIRQKKAQVLAANEEYLEQYQFSAESIAREKELFRLVNRGYAPFEEGSTYRILEAQCKQAAERIWELVRGKLASGFFGADLVSDVNESIVEQSITSDALFNSVFAINTIVNAGLDEDMEDKINYYTLSGSKEYEEVVDDYDEMRDTLRLGYDNVYQTYMRLRKRGKEYKVNEYLLSFGEKFSEEEIDNVKEMRKARIRVFSLMPLLVKTKTTLGEFVIRYPQYDMQLYLEQILEHRSIGPDGERLWVWEKEGYSSSSNYYYTSALSDFFRYYEEYELKYSQNANKNEAQKKRIREKYLEELRTESGEIGMLQRTVREAKEKEKSLETEIAELREKIDRLNDDPLRKALNDFIFTAVQERIGSIISDLFGNMAEQISSDAKERVFGNAGEDAEKNGFGESLRSLIFSLISERMLEAIRDNKTDPQKMDRAVNALEKNASADFGKALQIYFLQILQEGGSNYVASGGYRGIKAVLQREQTLKDEQKNKKE